MNKKLFPVQWLKNAGFEFYPNDSKRKILKDPNKKSIVEASVIKLKIWIYLFMFAYWPRNGGFSRVKAQVLNWIGFDEVAKIDNPVGLQCLILASNIHKIVLTIFRGTDKVETRKDWKINAKIKHKNFNMIFHRLVNMFPEDFSGLMMPNNCGEGHTGYVHSVVSAFPDIWPILRKYIKKGYDHSSGGHSKGGGESVIFCYMLVKLLGLKVRECITIGQPRALDKTAAAEFQTLVKHYRIINPGDTIPKFPTGISYDHTDTRYILSLKGVRAAKYGFKEFSSNLARRSLSLLRFNFLWGTSKHYADVYLKRLNKIYKKFETEIL